MYPGDDNHLYGGIGPGTDAAFYGSEVALAILMIPTDYTDNIHMTSNLGFRLQFTESIVISPATFSTVVTEVQGDMMYNSSYLPLATNYITDTTFVDPLRTNSIDVAFQFQRSPQQLIVSLDPIETWLDVYSLIGGMVASVSAIYVMAMVFIEKWMNGEYQAQIAAIFGLKGASKVEDVEEKNKKRDKPNKEDDKPKEVTIKAPKPTSIEMSPATAPRPVNMSGQGPPPVPPMPYRVQLQPSAYNTSGSGPRPLGSPTPTRTVNRAISARNAPRVLVGLVIIFDPRVLL